MSGSDSNSDPDPRPHGYAEETLATLLVLVGAALFFFPEPATSAIGVALVVVGVIAWLVEWWSS